MRDDDRALFDGSFCRLCCGCFPSQPARDNHARKHEREGKVEIAGMGEPKGYRTFTINPEAWGKQHAEFRSFYVEDFGGEYQIMRGADCIGSANAKDYESRDEFEKRKAHAIQLCKDTAALQELLRHAKAVCDALDNRGNTTPMTASDGLRRAIDNAEGK